MDGFHHVFEDGVKDLPSLFRIAVSQQFHRTLEVREQDRDLLTLAFQCGLGVDDPLGEVLRCVGLG
jgi:hypothetical protein